MLNKSLISHAAMSGAISSASSLRPSGMWGKKELGATMLLTSLIDAFSILVIFLLVSFSADGELITLSKGEELPMAALVEQLERAPVVKVENGEIYLDNTVVTPEGLIQGLIDLRHQFAKEKPEEEFLGIMTVQADRRVKYELLNKIILASSHAGYSDIRFAVMAK